MRRLAASLAVGAVVVSAAAFTGYNRGQADAQAKFNAERLARIEAGKKLDAARIEVMLERDELQRQLEEQANAETVSSVQCFSPSRVHRLNKLR